MNYLENHAMAVVRKLEQIRMNRGRQFSAEIDAVLVFSGPGTYYDRLKSEQEEWERWMDRDRIRAGVAIVREITALKKSQEYGFNIKGNKTSLEDIREYGPILVYNGIPVENEVFRTALNSPYSKIPRDKVLIIDNVESGESTHPIRHTGDQYRSFFQEVSKLNNPLHNINNVALVSHIPHFIRHPFYVTLFNDEFEKHMGRRLKFWAYGIMSRANTSKIHINVELPKLVPYVQRKQLAGEPTPLII